MQHDANWHRSQDQQISEDISVIDRMGDDECPIIRVMSYCDDVITEQHFISALTLFRRTQTFSVFDLGFGRGRLLAQIAMHFPNAEIHGIDDNDESIERARVLVPRAKLEKGTYDTAKGQFDLVICSQVFEHVEDTDALLDKLFFLTKVGGHISFSTPSGWTYRRPRLGNFYHAITQWNFHRRVRLQPEKNWIAALPHHPSTQPSKAILRFKARGGAIVSRRSAMWLIQMNGPLHKFWNMVGDVKGAALSRYMTTFLNAAMNFVPGMRIFESQFVLLVRKN